MRGLDPRDVASAFFSGGARLLQIRQKSGGAADWLAIVRHAVAEAAPVDGRVIVNDRADLAAIAGAHGVHVGQHDLPLEAIRPLLSHTAILGISTHSVTQVDAAARGPATYIAVGPVYRTATKDTGYGPQGLDLVRHAAATGKPVVAIGGITLERAPEVLAAGAAAVAVISDLVAGGDPAARVRQYLAALGERRP